MRYLIGIDLGTTNSALSYVDLKQPGLREGRPELHSFAVPQLAAPGEVAQRALLPSFLYLPGAHDLPAGSTALPWDPGRAYAVGEFAHNHGARVPGRLVTSAKSWLCHAGVDRSAPLLPWSAPPDVPRISPVEATGRYLRHLIEAWNHEMAHDQSGARLEEQAVVLTVPASFDDVARNLTVEAARQAGLEQVALLEEPQAAFYCWLATHPVVEIAALKPGAHCLVVDVGGGTSDFSLIQAVEQQGEIGFIRQAVGDHLLLGGDNMDLALAKFVETKLPGAGKQSLDAAQYGTLTQACRLAKETLLGPEPPDSYTVTVVGRGRQIVGGTLHAAINPDEVCRVLFDGFFPQVPADAEPQRGARVGLHEMGLPYVSDPAITRHLAAFLRQHADAGRETMNRPDAILFNGGVFQPAPLRARLLDVLRHWFDRPERSWNPLVLTNPSLDLAVAWGAAHYAWLRHSGGKRIGGGIARSYYVGVADSESEKRAAEVQLDNRSSLPAPRSTLSLLCIVPQRLEEGQEVRIEKPELELSLGQPVVFSLYSSTVRGDDRAGDLLQVDPDKLLHLPPLHTILRGGKRSGTKSVPVALAARCTEIGTLELWCVARDGNNRWRLEFNVRDIVRDPRGAGDDADDAPSREDATTLVDVLPETQVQEAGRLIRAVYSAEGAQASAVQPQQLTKALEAVFESSRHDWPTALCRRLWEFQSEVADERRRSPDHLKRWYHLVGYCLRPGFGDPLDRFRVEQLWKQLHSPVASGGRKPAESKQPEGGADYWIMWRRVSGGLNLHLQGTLFNRLRAVLLPTKGKAVVRPGANELAEIWRAAASLERLDVKQKEALGQVLLKTVRRSPAPTYGFWAITRLGARVLLYGPLNAIVHRETIEQWIDALAGFEPGHDSERLAFGFCLAQLARKSGQRALDVDDSHRQTVLATLRRVRVPEHWVKMVEEVAELESAEQSQLFGESLPIGLRLVRGEE